jgi:hypothetical protein
VVVAESVEHEPVGAWVVGGDAPRVFGVDQEARRVESGVVGAADGRSQRGIIVALG